MHVKTHVHIQNHTQHIFTVTTLLIHSYVLWESYYWFLSWGAQHRLSHGTLVQSYSQQVGKIDLNIDHWDRETQGINTYGNVSGQKKTKNCYSLLLSIWIPNTLNWVQLQIVILYFIILCYKRSDCINDIYWAEIQGDQHFQSSYFKHR